MPTVTAIYGDKSEHVQVGAGALLGEAIARTGLPLEQPCAGRGTCGQCKVLVESAQEVQLLGKVELLTSHIVPPDSVELENLSAGELALGTRLACRARVAGDVTVTLAPIVVYSNKVFRASSSYKRGQAPLGLAIDLGSTTVAAYLVDLDTGEVCAGAATLNQQAAYGADVISRLAAAYDPADAGRLRRLALSSINQAVDALGLSARVRARLRRAAIVGNAAMHHLLAGLPVDSLAELPFQPHSRQAITDARPLMDGIFPPQVEVTLPPLIGGFVGSDALACLAYFDFANPSGPLAVIDLGTNGEVLVSDGQRILAASTAAGPAFEGVNISCGIRAVDGAIVAVHLHEGGLAFDTIGERDNGAAAVAWPAGLTGSGLLSLVHVLRQAGVIEASGRFAPQPPLLAAAFDADAHGVRRLRLTADARLGLSQFDVRELQKAKAAIRAALDMLLNELALSADQLERVILTGSFGGQVDVTAALALGMLPPVRPDVVESIPNGAGLGAALFLSAQGFALGEALAARTEQIDLDLAPDFNLRYVEAMTLT